MPKGKRKDRRPVKAVESHSDDEQDASDDMSVISSTSETQSVVAEGVGADGEVDELASQEDFEDKLKDVIDGLTEKSAKGRVVNLTALKQALSKKFIEEFVADRKMTILDGLERCVKKGKGEEQALASQCVVLLSLQLGAGADGEEVYTTLKPILTTIMTDTSAALKARAACAFSLGILTFLSSEDIGDSYKVMQSLETIFRASFHKGDGTPASHTGEVAHLHSSALSAWALLATVTTTSVLNSYLTSHMRKFHQLLDSPDVDLRITAGETIALLYEMARDEDEEYEGPGFDDLCLKLKSLSTDSQKFRAKKDRRQQRSSFRDILHAVEEGEAPALRIRFGVESLEVDSWARKKHYDALCQALGIGTQIHLQENPLVRQIFDLGDPLPTSALHVKAFTKRERQHYNAEAFKARTKARSKNRDKRSAVLHNGS